MTGSMDPALRLKLTGEPWRASPPDAARLAAKADVEDLTARKDQLPQTRCAPHAQTLRGVYAPKHGL